jgi:transposase
MHTALLSPAAGNLVDRMLSPAAGNLVDRMAVSHGGIAWRYRMAVLPARPRKPKDKAKVEAAVLLAQRWIVARLRNETFASLGALNARIQELLVDLNGRAFHKMKGSRQRFFERYDKPALRALPPERFDLGLWKTTRVGLDCHVRLLGHHYSAPHEHVGEQVYVRHTPSLVEVFVKGERVASHA